MNMKNIFVIIGIAAALVGGYLYFSREAFEQREVHTIVALGDSLTQGYGSSEGNDYVSRLEVMLGKEIINMGVGGETSKGALARVDEVLQENPDMVIVFIGGNDVLRRMSHAETFENIEKIISRLVEHNIAVVLVGVPGGIITDPFDTEFERLADTYDIIYIPEFLGRLIRSREYMFDSIHPNDSGHEIIAQEIYEGIKDKIK